MGGALTRLLGHSSSGAVAAALSGALATSTSTSFTASPVPFAAADIYDTASYHDTVTNNTRITAPATGIYRISGNALDSGILFANLAKNAGDFVGQASMKGRSGARRICLTTGPIALSSGDYAQLQVSGGSASQVSGQWLAMEQLDSALKYALVYMSAGPAIASNTTITVGYDTEAADTNSFHDNVTNNTRLTVPSGVTRVRLVANAQYPPNGASTRQFNDIISMNGAQTAAGLGRSNCYISNSSPDAACNSVTAVLNVTAGDYFENLVYSNANSTVTATNLNRLWFSIEEVPSTYQCCLAKKSSGQALAATTDTLITWDAEEYDDASIHSTSSNTSRMTTPAGATYARLSYCITSTGTAAAGVSAYVTKNGAWVTGLPNTNYGFVTNTSANDMSAWVPCTAGDYFELQVAMDVAGTIGASSFNWFCAEFR